MNRNAISLVKIGLFSLLGLIIVVYSIFQAWKLITGPVIDVYSPENGATYNSALVEVNGRARNVAYLNLDGRPIFTDKDGYFKEQLLMSPGLNIIKLDAEDKFKTRTKKIIQVVLKDY